MASVSCESKFWAECIAEAASECGLSLTSEQLECMAEHVKGAHECYGMAFYQPESPYPAEIKRLEAQLKVERDKIACPKCKGSCVQITYGGTMQCTSQCPMCRGEGKVSR